MTPDVVVDIGNTRMKWGRCAAGGVTDMVALPLDDLNAWDHQAEAWDVRPAAWWAVASVNPPVTEAFKAWRRPRGGACAVFDRPSLLPIRAAVDAPDEVGIDRLLNALAARHRVPDGTPAVVISVGTAVTIDYVGPDGVFQGGAIFPGPGLMARSLHEHTAKLPLVEPEPELMTAYCGKNTGEAIRIGIQLAIVGAAEEAVYAFAYEMRQPVSVFVTGGGLHYFGSWEFAADTREIVLDPMLTLDGIRIAAESIDRRKRP
jgi:type III pantothenate kinase